MFQEYEIQQSRNRVAYLKKLLSSWRERKRWKKRSQTTCDNKIAEIIRKLEWEEMVLASKIRNANSFAEHERREQRRRENIFQRFQVLR